MRERRPITRVPGTAHEPGSLRRSPSRGFTDDRIWTLILWDWQPVSESPIDEGGVERREQHEEDDEGRQRQADGQIGEPPAHQGIANMIRTSRQALGRCVMKGTQPSETSANVIAVPARLATGDRYRGLAEMTGGMRARAT